MNAIDVSNFTGDVSNEQAKLVRDSNRLVIVGTQNAEIAIQQAKAFRSACLELQFYIMQYPDVPMERELTKAFKVIEALYSDSAFMFDGNPRVWLDFELALSFDKPSADMYIGWINRIVQRAQVEFGYTSVGIYTRRGWWVEHTGNTQELSHLPLWDANYDGIADLASFTPYGGWTTAPVMKQYTADFDLYGLKVDLNVF